MQDGAATKWRLACRYCLGVLEVAPYLGNLARNKQGERKARVPECVRKCHAHECAQRGRCATADAGGFGVMAWP
ncbi:hypothetical protein EVAR_34476_1 [Eumeta japonica]|uniref:Uncharacterized protein n=1 Tax=Eumeta variegata TaxID=151549 RepID=A0A4C1WUK5_EUMVA|nr:hypothetical protein EVAR_34476_1 [Eumeta japonica]